MFRKILFGAVSMVALAIGAAQADEIKEFRIGILGGENEADRLRNYQCLSDQLKTLLGVEKVSLFPAADYDGVIQGLLGGTLDYAELGAEALAKVYLENRDASRTGPDTVQPTVRRLLSIMWSRAIRASRRSRDEGQASWACRSYSTSGYLIPYVAAEGHRWGGEGLFRLEPGSAAAIEQLVLEVLKGTFDAGTHLGSGAANSRTAIVRQSPQDGREAS